MNSLKDGIDFLNIQKSKYNNDLNKLNLSQNNTSGYNSIIENLDNIDSIASISPIMNTNLNKDEILKFETLDKSLKKYISDYKDTYFELENLLTDLNQYNIELNKLSLEKSNLENKMKPIENEIDALKSTLNKYNTNETSLGDNSDLRFNPTDMLLMMYLDSLSNGKNMDDNINNMGVPEEIKSLYNKIKSILQITASKIVEIQPLSGELFTIDREITTLEANIRSYTTDINIKFNILVSINNDIKNIMPNILKNINSLKEKNTIDSQYNSAVVDSFKKSIKYVETSFKKIENIVSDINNYKPSINGNYNLLSIDRSIPNLTNTEFNKSINDNYKYANINFLAMKEDSLRFNKYQKYQYIIWLIFILIILLMVYKSITDNGPISITTGLVSLTFLFLFYYVVTLLIR